MINTSWRPETVGKRIMKTWLSTIGDEAQALALAEEIDAAINAERSHVASLESEIRSMLGATPWSTRDPSVVEVHQMMVPGATAKRWRRLLKIDSQLSTPG